MTRPGRFEDHRFLGDKRTQVVYDLDLVEAAGLEDAIDELVASEQFLAFGPDTLTEARNRCYRLHRAQRELGAGGASSCSASRAARARSGATPRRP